MHVGLHDPHTQLDLIHMRQDTSKDREGAGCPDPNQSPNPLPCSMAKKILLPGNSALPFRILFLAIPSFFPKGPPVYRSKPKGETKMPPKTAQGLVPGLLGKASSFTPPRSALPQREGGCESMKSLHSSL